MDSIVQILTKYSVLLSTIAVVLALLTLGFSVIRDIRHRRQWENVNLARVVIRNLQLVKWRVLSLEDAGSIDFGYADPFLIPDITTSGQIQTHLLGTPTQVAAFNADGSMVDGINAITKEELLSAIRAKGRNPDEFTLRKFYRITFTLVNSGLTVADRVNVSVFAIIGSKEEIAVVGGAPQRLESDEESWTFMQFWIPLEMPFPSTLTLRIRLSFADVHGREHMITHEYEYDRKVASFRRIESRS